MKSSIFYLVILLTFSVTATGQKTSTLNASNEPKAANKPLVLVDSFKTDINYLIVDPKKIDSIIVVKGENALSRFGEAGKYGAIIILPKKLTNFLRVDKILDKYNLSQEEKKLRICINKTLILERELILIEESEIINVEIITNRHWTEIEDANSNEKFINIITKATNNTSPQ